MKRRLWIQQALLTLTAGSVKPAAAARGAAPPVQLAVGDWAPFFGADLPGQGLFAEIVRQAFSREGLGVNFLFMPWRRALAEVESGKLHGSPGWAYSEERAARFLYSDPVIMSRDALFFLKSRPLDFRNDEQLRGRTLGATAGYHYGPLVQQYESQGQVQLDRAPSDEASLRKLLLARIDAVLMNREVGLHLLATRFSAEERALIGASARDISAKTSHMLMSLQHADVPAMLESFNRGLAALRREGRIQSILAGLPGSTLPAR